MKLKHGKQFANKPGSTWRLLFVFALFPWLRQYRILDRKREELAELRMESLTNNLLTSSARIVEDTADPGLIKAIKEEMAELIQKMRRIEKNQNS